MTERTNGEGLTLAEWLAAAGRQDTCSEWDLRAAWQAGEDPCEYRVPQTEQEIEDYAVQAVRDYRDGKP